MLYAMNNTRNYCFCFFLFLLSFLAICTTTSCEDDSEDGCFGTTFEFEYTTNIELRDKNTDELLIGTIGRRYRPSLGIYLTDTMLNEVFYDLLDGVIRFDILFDETADLQQPQETVYYLDLPPWDGNHARDIDTLSFILSIDEINDICASHKFSYLKFTYNQTTIFEGDPNTLGSREYLVVSK